MEQRRVLSALVDEIRVDRFLHELAAMSDGTAELEEARLTRMLNTRRE